MEQYIAIIKDDITRFIQNYLIAGQLQGISGMSDLEEYIPSQFPYLSILYLLKKNDLDEFEEWFIENFRIQLQEETGKLKLTLGHFLLSEEEKDELLKDLTNRNNVLDDCANSLRKENTILKQQISELRSEISQVAISRSSFELPLSRDLMDVVSQAIHFFYSINDILSSMLEKLKEKRQESPISQMNTHSSYVDVIKAVTLEDPPQVEKHYSWQTESFKRIIENDRKKFEEAEKRRQEAEKQRQEAEKRRQEEIEREEMLEKYYRKHN